MGKSIRDSRFDLYDRIPSGHVARGMERGWRRNEDGKEKRRNGERKSKEDSGEEVDRYCLSDRNYSIQDFISIERCGGQRKILFTRDLQFPFSLVSKGIEKKETFRTYGGIFPRTISRGYVDRRGGDSIIRYKCASSMYERDISRAMGRGLEIYRANTLLLLCASPRRCFIGLFLLAPTKSFEFIPRNF